MKFATPLWLLGSLAGLVVAGLLIAGGMLLLRAVRRFGDEDRIAALVTQSSGSRRALKGSLLVLAVVCGFVALAQPQYGRGTRLIPATNLDVVIVLDYSKSMYARDVTPSRTARAKTEVARLIADLPGARFGAVAFAGEPLSFPLTSDGAAIAQFFRQMTPNEMPVGGTAIARALEGARDLLSRDPLSSKHRRVIVLVTDGEDLEGDPVSVARAAGQDQTAVWVAQIGGRTPEPIPEVNEAGEVIGLRSDEEGKPVTTELSAAGEAQLGQIADVSGGRVVRAGRGETGLTDISSALRQLMTEELSEKVETVYADVYVYPLALMLLLMLVECFVPETSRRARPTLVAPPPAARPKRRKAGRSARSQAAATIAGSLLALLVAAAACSKGNKDPFIRNAPPVDQAIKALDAGDAAAATDLLQRYLSTGSCDKGEIGVPDQVRDRPNASFDLGLGLFKLGEQFGVRFGDEDVAIDGGPTPDQEAALSDRKERVACALRIVRAVADDASVPIELRARAHYLAGNLEFLRHDYKAAVREYDQALKLIPGLPEDAGDGIGRDAAWNRAVALRRQEDEEQKKKDAASDAPKDAPPDSPKESGSDGGDKPDGGDKQEGGHDSGDQHQPDGGQNQDGGDPQDAGSKQNEAGAPPEPPKPKPEKGTNANQDDRLLDQLERAPMLQHQGARGRAQRGAGAMEDK